ncbi:hypothetical protein [Rhodococcus tukisamuensis]|uniref:hypothetical protein n=1 Tax=Rhodococcus tukisamuensis TaxID=168276 RepID=UPI001474CF16|nr:hypothetical protein [Rhodococcus tukisamuensis]
MDSVPPTTADAVPAPTIDTVSADAPSKTKDRNQVRMRITLTAPRPDHVMITSQFRHGNHATTTARATTGPHSTSEDQPISTLRKQ